MTNRSMRVSARREHSSALRSVGRFCGVSAALAALRRSPLLRTHQNRVTTFGSVLSAIAAVAVVALLIPSTRPAIARVITAPGAIVDLLGGGATASDADKSLPRIYSVKLGVDIPIKPGDGGLHVPVKPIAFQLPATAPVGKPGNTYLYAHDRPGMFLGLHKASIGDVMIVQTSPTDKLYYQITEIHASVAWNDLEWMGPTTDTRLTLQTCNLSGDYDPRFIVVARLIPVTDGRALTNGV